MQYFATECFEMFHFASLTPVHPYLRDLGRNYATYWQDYLDELAAKNLSRDPVARR
jgi:DUF971 family protein